MWVNCDTVTHEEHGSTLGRKEAPTQQVTQVKVWHQGLGTWLRGQKVHLAYPGPRVPCQHHISQAQWHSPEVTALETEARGSDVLIILG